MLKYLPLPLRNFISLFALLHRANEHHRCRCCYEMKINNSLFELQIVHRSYNDFFLCFLFICFILCCSWPLFRINIICIVFFLSLFLCSAFLFLSIFWLISLHMFCGADANAIAVLLEKIPLNERTRIPDHESVLPSFYTMFYLFSSLEMHNCGNCLSLSY